MNTHELILDGTKILWHRKRVEAWRRGDRISPITVEMALNRSCNFSCDYCYARYQENVSTRLDRAHALAFLDDCKELGVKGVAVIGDGESTLSSFFDDFIIYGKGLGLSMALGTNGYHFHATRAERILPWLDYCRFSIASATREGFMRIMGAGPVAYMRVRSNIADAVCIKKGDNLPVTIGMQMVVKPDYAAEILPLAYEAVHLGVDYLIYKHCSDTADGAMGVDYDAYADIQPLLKQAESLSTPRTAIRVKWSKMNAGRHRTYVRCYGPPFMLQISGTGLVAPCGMFFDPEYKDYWLGNIATERFFDIVTSDRYWRTMTLLGSDNFDARLCPTLCHQHHVNTILDDLGSDDSIPWPGGDPPTHLNFI